MIFNHFKSSEGSDELYCLSLLAIEMTTVINPLVECIISDIHYLEEYPYRKESILKYNVINLELVDIAFERKKSSIAQVKNIEKEFLEVFYGEYLKDLSLNFGLGEILVWYIIENKNITSFHESYKNNGGQKLDQIINLKTHEPTKKKYKGLTKKMLSCIIFLCFLEEFIDGKTTTRLDRYTPKSWLLREVLGPLP